MLASSNSEAVTVLLYDTGKTSSKVHHVLVLLVIFLVNNKHLFKTLSFFFFLDMLTVLPCLKQVVLSL